MKGKSPQATTIYALLEHRNFGQVVQNGKTWLVGGLFLVRVKDFGDEGSSDIDRSDEE